MRSYTELKSQLKILYGNTRVLQVVVGRVMFAHIVLRGLQVERVLIRGLDEEDALDGKWIFFFKVFDKHIKSEIFTALIKRLKQFLGLDLTTASQYKVMRLITEHASASALFYTFSREARSDESLQIFLCWLRLVDLVFLGLKFLAWSDFVNLIL